LAEEIQWGKRVVTDWVRVHLPAADRGQICELLEEGWRAKAPKRVLAAFDASRNRTQTLALLAEYARIWPCVKASTTP
jgi:hypothetical protein